MTAYMLLLLHIDLSLCHQRNPIACYDLNEYCVGFTSAMNIREKCGCCQWMFPDGNWLVRVCLMDWTDASLHQLDAHALNFAPQLCGVAIEAVGLQPYYANSEACSTAAWWTSKGLCLPHCIEWRTSSRQLLPCATVLLYFGSTCERHDAVRWCKFVLVVRRWICVWMWMLLKAWITNFISRLAPSCIGARSTFVYSILRVSIWI